MRHRLNPPFLPLALALFVVTWDVPARGAPPKSAKKTPPAPHVHRTLSDALSQRLLDPLVPLQEVQDYIDNRIPSFPKVRTSEEWQCYADRARKNVLERVVFRGQAAVWRTQPTRAEWLDSIEGGPGYRIRKLRYEAVPGLWIPALLYEPTTFTESKVPVSLAVNGHDAKGKSADYKQLRCINQAKRGMIVLNTEFLGMGQLTGPNFNHYRMNQLDLCGTSGLAPFYLVMSRGLDILLQHEHADPKRVAVQGLSGGGWQTITISSLDTRVTLCNPVAGYSSLRTRVRNVSDLGDSEQNPVDLETIVDYSQMTAMLAPRPALLTYNMTDDCCFRAEHALPPLIGSARPIYALFNKAGNLREHVNQDPGTHNYGLDNRQHFYAMLKDFFFDGHADVPIAEIPSEKELKTPEQLNVPLPHDNAEFNRLAKALSASIPESNSWPQERGALSGWQKQQRAKLEKILHAHKWALAPVAVADRTVASVQERDWWLRLGSAWTVPAIELTSRKAQGTAIVICDRGRGAALGEIEVLMKNRNRVLAVDLFYFGDSKIPQRDMLFAIAISSVGERPLGIQASQLRSIARWRKERDGAPPQVVAIGPRSSLVALAAAALEPDAIRGLTLHQSMGSLKEVIEENRTVEEAPEFFCFGLLEKFDVSSLVSLVAPRPVSFVEPSPRVRTEMAKIAPLFRSLQARLELGH